MSIYPEDASDPPFKQVCSYYGLAMYAVQVLEHGLVNALVWLDLHPKTEGKWTPDEFEEFIEARFSETLRELAKRIKKHAVVSDELSARLEECNRRRRLLAHRFFMESAEETHLEQFEAVIDRLIDDQEYFFATDRILEDAMEPILERLGFSVEYRMRAAAEYSVLLKMVAAVKPPPADPAE